MHWTTYKKMNWFKENYLNENYSLKILDVGSLDTSGENYNYKSIFNENPNWLYVGLDFQDGENVDILVNDIYNWIEIEDNSFDVVISGQLFEHLEYFWLTMGEIDRVLKPGGFCCIIAPAGGPKHGAAQTDCYRFNVDGLRAISKYVNFEVLHTSTNEDSKPWRDTCVIAKKEGNLNVNQKDLELKVEDLEKKLNQVLGSVEKG